jgi:hypothetical protein
MSNASSVQSLLGAAASGAAIVLFGALYALLLALAHLQQRTALLAFAYAAYVCLVASTIVLARTLGMHGVWLLVPMLLLIGYLLAPHGVWRLCVGIHDNTHSGGDRSRQETRT